jgi:uncharacterized protein YjdB
VTYDPNPKITKSVTVNVKGIAVTGITLSKTAFTAEPNATRIPFVKATIQPADAYVKETYWKSSNPAVANITDNDPERPYYNIYTGDCWLDTGDKAGKATLTFYVDDGTTVHEASVEVTVVRSIGSLKIRQKNGKSIKNLTLGLQKKGNNTYPLEAFSDDITYKKGEVTWKSSKSSVASINKDGVLNLKKEGSTTITASLNDGSGKKATLKLTVKKNLINKLSGNRVLTVREGKEIELKWKYINYKTKYDEYKVEPYYTKLSFKSDDPGIASVNQDGLVVGIKAGKTKITVKTNDGSKLKFVITVKVKEAAEARDITITHE